MCMQTTHASFVAYASQQASPNPHVAATPTLLLPHTLLLPPGRLTFEMRATLTGTFPSETLPLSSRVPTAEYRHAACRTHGGS